MHGSAQSEPPLPPGPLRGRGDLPMNGEVAHLRTTRLDRPLKRLRALHAEAVPAEIVMAAGRAHQPPRRIGCEPSLVLAAIPDSIFGPEHPSVPFAVEHREVAHREPKRAGLEQSAA